MEEKKHKRRVRYSGKYPKHFNEKYKELQPEKYKDTVLKVIEKGGTPAGMHISICVKEILDFFQIRPGQKGLDATFGYGGHTRAMLERLEGQGHIYALDVDPIESEKTKKRLENLGYGPEILTVRLQNFADLDQVCKEAGTFDFLDVDPIESEKTKKRLENLGYGPEILTVRLQNFADLDQVCKEAGTFDFILADLGVSSMQIDNPERGFSYKVDGPLDLRMNPQKGISAAERLEEVEYEELVGMLVENADEPYAREITDVIFRKKKKGEPIQTTTALRKAIEEALSFIPEKERKEAVKKSCQRTFQALRIDINQEFEALYSFLEKLPDALSEGGRVAILTFHSGEDRLVKKSLKQFYKAGIYKEISNEVIRPSAEECIRNSRAKCLTFHSGEDRLVKKSLKQFYKAGIYKEISNEVIRPSAEECIRNSRAKCTKMRWAIRA